MTTRRSILLGGGALAALSAVAAGGALRSRGREGEFEFVLTEAEWRERLTPQEFAVLRGHDTEAPFSSPLNEVAEPGVFTCAGCDHALFATEAKFDSGTGWPSFAAPLEGGVGTRPDYKLVIPRTEVHCARCGGHLGHVFEDGPAHTGLRYCMNGVAMDFEPLAA
jgi:peptide-methionine (R)-S-oxide reductase